MITKMNMLKFWNRLIDLDSDGTEQKTFINYARIMQENWSATIKIIAIEIHI